MDKKRVEWRVTLQRSNYRQTKYELVPKVILSGTLTLDHLIDRIAERGSALHAEVLRHAAAQLADEMEDALIDGYAISTPLGMLTPTVTGVWSTDRIQPTERALNGATVRYTLSPGLKKALSDPLLHEKGMRAQRLGIFRVRDVASDTENQLLTPGQNIIIDGDSLLMNGTLPQCGIYFLDAGTGQVASFVPPAGFAANTRRRIILIVPANLPGEAGYRIRVVSQCTTNPKPMKEAAEYTMPTLFTIARQNTPQP